jgi:hypothetical protein
LAALFFDAAVEVTTVTVVHGDEQLSALLKRCDVRDNVGVLHLGQHFHLKIEPISVRVPQTEWDATKEKSNEAKAQGDKPLAAPLSALGHSSVGVGENAEGGNAHTECEKTPRDQRCVW